MKLGETVVRRGLSELVDIDGERRSSVKLLKAPRRTFELDSRLLANNAIALAHNARRIGARLLAQRLDRLGRKLDHDARNSAALEK